MALLLLWVPFAPARAEGNGTSASNQSQISDQISDQIPDQIPGQIQVLAPAQDENAAMAEEAAEGIRVHPAREWFREGEDIVVTVSGFPGNRLDWATLAPYGAPDDAHGEVLYARGRQNATFSFPPLPSSRYELRIFFDSPGLEDKVLFRFPLWVAPAKGKSVRIPEYQKVSASKYVFAPEEPVAVRYENFPGNAEDWVTIVPRGAPRDAHGVTKSTGGRNHGNFTFPGLPEGEYEVRAYYDWPMGGYRIQTRYAFKVLPAGWNVGRYIHAGSEEERGFFEPGAARSQEGDGDAEEPVGEARDNGAPDAIFDAAPDAAKGMAQDKAPDSPPDVAPDSAPDVAVDVAPALDAEASGGLDGGNRSVEDESGTADGPEANRTAGAEDGG